MCEGKVHAHVQPLYSAGLLLVNTYSRFSAGLLLVNTYSRFSAGLLLVNTYSRFSAGLLLLNMMLHGWYLLLAVLVFFLLFTHEAQNNQVTNINDQGIDSTLLILNNNSTLSKECSFRQRFWLN